jgi:predicted ATPase
MRDYLVRLSCDRPVATLLDDLQWADPGSVDLLRVLARELVDVPILLVGTYPGRMK